ncbi:MAG: gamma-glutamyltransferase [Rhodovarius sp.]|nr:gamma-glutamyltransferase [Rhodovarius sp.]MDW8314693.1 gamma-glutamyltransferase [Rhodovarius sp.]
MSLRLRKRPATGRAMVVTNHPAASAAAATMLAEGGTAVDAAVAGLFALSVCEPMMVGLFGGGMFHLRQPDGRHVIFDGGAAAPAAAHASLFTPARPDDPFVLEAVGRANMVGPLSVAAPANLLAWCAVLKEAGRFSLADVMAPAIRLAREGFRVSAYLHECIAECAADLRQDAGMAAIFLPDGAPVAVGSRLSQPALADTLAIIAREGPGALHGGAVGQAAVAALAARGGILTLADLAGQRVVERSPLRGSYRGFEVVAPPPPSAGGVHLLQMLNLVEAFDLRALGFGSPAALHLVAEALKLAFADRAVATADPDFVPVPIERLTSKTYAAERRAEFDPQRARRWAAGIAPLAEAHTTHLTIADAEGRVVAATHTINSLFGARILLGETGLIPNNYMALFDPRPGRANSIAPGKRVTTSMAPSMLLRGGAPWAAIGLPGGLRIFGSVFQAVLNLVDHGMTAQQAVEAPRIWTQGGPLELEPGISPAAEEALAAMGHPVQRVPVVGGGMSCIRFHPDGMLEGAACWRADGTPIALAGGDAEPGVRFVPEAS